MDAFVLAPAPAKTPPRATPSGGAASDGPAKTAPDDGPAFADEVTDETRRAEVRSSGGETDEEPSNQDLPDQDAAEEPATPMAEKRVGREEPKVDSSSVEPVAQVAIAQPVKAAPTEDSGAAPPPPARPLQTTSSQPGDSGLREPNTAPGKVLAEGPETPQAVQKPVENAPVEAEPAFPTTDKARPETALAETVDAPTNPGPTAARRSADIPPAASIVSTPATAQAASVTEAQKGTPSIATAVATAPQAAPKAPASPAAQSATSQAAPPVSTPLETTAPVAAATEVESEPAPIPTRGGYHPQAERAAQADLRAEVRSSPTTADAEKTAPIVTSDGADGPAPASNTKPATVTAGQTLASPLAAAAPVAGPAVGVVDAQSASVTDKPQTPMQGGSLDRAITNQIVTAVHTRGGTGTIEVQLDPPELGRIEISIDVAEQGLKATVVADRLATVDLIKRHGDLLLQQFEEAGFSDVDLSFSGQSDQGAQRDREATNGSPQPWGLMSGPESSAQVAAALTSSAPTDRIDIRL